MTTRDLQTLPNILGWWLVSQKSEKRPLTPREQQVVDRVTNGSTHKEVAFELGLSYATVRVLYSRAMQKLGRTRRKSTP